MDATKGTLQESESSRGGFRPPMPSDRRGRGRLRERREWVLAPRRGFATAQAVDATKSPLRGRSGGSCGIVGRREVCDSGGRDADADLGVVRPCGRNANGEV